MTTKFRIILSGIIIAGIAIFIYLSLRLNVIEEDYVNSLVKTSQNIIKDYKDLENKNKGKKIEFNDLSVFIKEINHIYGNIALIAVAENNLIRIASKNDKFITTGKLYDSIKNDFTGEKFTMPANKAYLKRYYGVKINNEKEQLKFYIFVKAINKNKLLIVFPYKPGKKILTKIGLEIALIIIIFIIAITAFYLVLQKHGKVAGAKDIEFNTIELDSKKKPIESEVKKESIDASRIASESLNLYIYDLFKSIYSKYSPESISLYLKKSSDILSKKYELKGKSFIKIDSDSFDTIDINNEVGDELRKSASIILNNGKKVILPLIYDNSFLGIINIIREDALNGDEIKDIKLEVISITKHLSEYLVIDNVMVDKESGLYSTTYFKLKYNEQLKISQLNGKDFSLLFVSLGNSSTSLSQSQRNGIIKLVSPVIVEHLKDDDCLCFYDMFLGIVMPEITSDKAVKIAGGIVKTLSKYRIKISVDNIFQITPYIGISSTDKIDSVMEMENTGVRNLEHAMTRDEAGIQI